MEFKVFEGAVQLNIIGIEMVGHILKVIRNLSFGIDTKWMSHWGRNRPFNTHTETAKKRFEKVLERPEVLSNLYDAEKLEEMKEALC